MNYWLLKAEPDGDYSISDLEKDLREPWTGIRNYQARNFIRDEMKEGDWAVFYHSNCTPPHAAGVCRIVGSSYPDPTAFDPQNKYFDEKSTPEKPRWYAIDVEFVSKFDRIVPLSQMRECKDLENMRLLQKGNRLSILPVEKSEFTTILSFAGSIL